jgi:hypothetical protein
MSARLGAFFFLLRHEPMPSIDELATGAGVTELSLGPFPEQEKEPVRYGRWRGVLSVEARLQHLDLHDLLAIDFWQGAFFNLRPAPIDPNGNDALPLEEDGALPVALAFRDACERLRPEAAVLASHPHMTQDPQWLHACYSAVLGMDPTLLDSYGGGLVYVGPDMAAEWEPDRFGSDRDSLPVAEGQLLFRSTGWGRWF